MRRQKDINNLLYIIIIMMNLLLLLLVPINIIPFFNGLLSLVNKSET